MFKMQRELSFVLFSITVVHAVLSGLYVDNGVDQTIIQRTLSTKEKQDVSHDLLNLLGLPLRPKHLFSNATSIEGSVPKFLMDIYRSLDNPRRTTRSEFNLGGKDLQSIDESDMIMGFSSRSKFSERLSREQEKKICSKIIELKKR